MYVCMYVYIYIYIHMFTHTYIHQAIFLFDDVCILYKFLSKTPYLKGRIGLRFLSPANSNAKHFICL